MSEATIDKLSIEITSNSTGAAEGIGKLADELGKLKTNGSIGVACKNLERLSDALKKLTPVTSNANKLSALATSIKDLSGAGSIASVVNQLNKLPGALKGLSGLNIDNNLGNELEGLARAMSPMSQVKAGGIGTIANALTKLQNIDLRKIRFEDTAIEGFVAEIKKLDDAIGPLSTKMTTIGKAFNAVNTSARSAGGGLSAFDGKVKTTRLNLANLITVIQGVKAAIMPMVHLLSGLISDAIEWDGVANRFGRGFGDSAQETYEWIQRLNEEMGINVQQFMQYSSVYATMLTGFGVAVEDANKMALGYTELTYDIWAGFNDIYKNYADAADAVRSAIAGEVEPIRRAGFTIVESQLEQTAANHGLEISLEKATEAQKSYLRYLTLVDQAHAQNLVGTYARELNTAEGVMRTFAQQVKSMAQALGSLFLPILVKVMPWIQAFIELLTAAIRAVATFFGITIQPIDWGSSIGGGVSGLGELADSADTASDSLGKTAGSAGKAKKAVEDLRRATIGIDELNVISPPDEHTGSGGSGGSGGVGGVGGGGTGFEDMDIGSLWDESIFDQIQFEVDEIIGKIKEALSTITAVVSGFMLAIGTILVVSGANIPLGLALMAVGAVGLVAVIAENWNGMSDQLAKTLTLITGVLGGFLLAIGAFLVFSGVNVGLGAALMAAGAISLATAATINWKFLNGDMKNALSILTGIVSGALLAMGALFAFTGVDVPLGIALMVAGAVGLATAVGLNWDFMSKPVKKAVGTLEAIVGGALLTLGAILTFTGANLPLGIGLMAAGAVSLVSATALNWDSLTGDVKNTVATITTLVSGALLGVGAVLAFSGVSIPLGIAMIAAGAVGIIASAPVNWKSLTKSIKAALKEIGAAVGVALLALGAVLAFSGASMPIGIAMMVAGGASLVSAIALNWDSVVTSVKNVLKKIGIAVGGALLAVGAVLVLSGVAVPLGISLLAAGAVGLASGVALNWDSVVTSVKNVLKKIGIAAGGAMLALGLILCLSGVGIPLGIALIATGATSLVSGVALNWDSLLGKLKKAWAKVEGWWNSVKELDPVGIAVSLVKKGWTTVKGWIGKIPGVSQAVGLVKSGWSTVKKWVGSIPSLSQTIKLVKSGWSSVKKWIGSIPAVSQSVKLVKSGWSSVKKWVGTMPTLSAGIKLVKSGWSSVKSWLGSLNFKLGFSLPKIGINWGTKTFAGFKISYPKGFYTYAKGGFPDTGELFVAREAGPEMVGKIGSKTTVANNQQIVEGISEGVYAAVLAAMKAADGSGTQNINVYLDSRQITSSVEKRQRERGTSIMGNQVYAY